MNYTKWNTIAMAIVLIIALLTFVWVRSSYSGEIVNDRPYDWYGPVDEEPEGPLSIEVQTRIMAPAEEGMSTEYPPIALKLHHKSGLFLQGTYEQWRYAPNSERLYEVDLFGIGAGYRYHLTEYLSLSGALSYYITSGPTLTNDRESFRYLAHDTLAGVDPKQVRRFAHNERKYVEFEDYFGFEFEVMYARTLGPVDLGIGAGYRILELRRHVYSHDHPTNLHPYWVIHGDDNFGGLYGALTIEIPF